MRRKLSIQFCLLSISLLSGLASSVMANGFRLPDQDAFATARGEAFVATADNPSAVYYNPAGITQLRGHNVRIGAYGIFYKTRFTSSSGNSHDTKDAFDVLPHFYYAYTPEAIPLAFGLGFYAPYGLGTEWSQDTGFRSLGLEAKLSYLTINPVVAWRVIPQLSLAVGPTLNYSQTDLKQGVTPFPNNDVFRFKGDATDVGFNTGIRWTPHEKLAFGLTYRSKTTMDYSGHTELNIVAPPISQRQDAHAKLAFPQDLVVGISYRPTPKWNIEFNLDWTDWSRLDSLAIRQTTPVPPLALNWHSSFLYEFGLTREVGKGWHVSAGYVFNENSVPDATFNPLLPDMNRHFASAGLGYRGTRFSFDAGYQFSYGPSRTVNGSAASLVGQTADGKYEWNSHAIIVSAAYHF